MFFFFWGGARVPVGSHETPILLYRNTSHPFCFSWVAMANYRPPEVKPCVFHFEALPQEDLGRATSLQHLDPWLWWNRFFVFCAVFAFLKRPSQYLVFWCCVGLPKKTYLVTLDVHVTGVLLSFFSAKFLANFVMWFGQVEQIQGFFSVTSCSVFSTCMCLSLVSKQGFLVFLQEKWSEPKDCSHNFLMSLPKSLGRCSALKTLCIAACYQL